MTDRMRAWFLEATTPDELNCFTKNQLEIECQARGLSHIPQNKNDLCQVILQDNAIRNSTSPPLSQQSPPLSQQSPPLSQQNPPISMQSPPISQPNPIPQMQYVVVQQPDTSENVPKFGGKAEESLSYFIDEIEHNATLSAWTEQAKLAVANKHLVGLARNWYVRDGRNIQNWAQWKRSIKSYFHHDQTVTQWVEMIKARNQRKDENLVTYV